MKVVLASQSPRRRELLEQAGILFEVHVSHVDETLTKEQQANPAEAACMLADRKAGVVAQELLTPGLAEGEAQGKEASTKSAGEQTPASPITEPTFVIGADTMVVLDNRIFGKPHTPSEAVGMLRKLSGRTHEVITGVAVWGLSPAEDGNVSAGHTTFFETSQVTFRNLSAEEITAYVAEGECFDKAGAYAIQAGGGQFVESYEGPLDNIIGLPVERLVTMFPSLKQ